MNQQNAMNKSGANEAKPAPAQHHLRAGATSEAAKNQPVNEDKPAKWELIALWLFLAGIGIASVVVSYLLWHQLFPHSP